MKKILQAESCQPFNCIASLSKDSWSNDVKAINDLFPANKSVCNGWGQVLIYTRKQDCASSWVNEPVPNISALEVSWLMKCHQCRLLVLVVPAPGVVAMVSWSPTGQSGCHSSSLNFSKAGEEGLARPTLHVLRWVVLTRKAVLELLVSLAWLLPWDCPTLWQLPCFRVFQVVQSSSNQPRGCRVAHAGKTFSNFTAVWRCLFDSHPAPEGQKQPSNSIFIIKCRQDFASIRLKDETILANHCLWLYLCYLCKIKKIQSLD